MEVHPPEHFPNTFGVLSVEQILFLLFSIYSAFKSNLFIYFFSSSKIGTLSTIEIDDCHYRRCP